MLCSTVYIIILFIASVKTIQDSPKVNVVAKNISHKLRTKMQDGTPIPHTTADVVNLDSITNSSSSEDYWLMDCLKKMNMSY